MDEAVARSALFRACLPSNSTTWNWWRPRAANDAYATRLKSTPIDSAGLRHEESSKAVCGTTLEAKFEGASAGINLAKM
jgi:hypothetical protein